jgi:cellulose synthase/poly-beta-1,6-N-acetylglucosamine synthase-like glycosyltransferase
MNQMKTPSYRPYRDVGQRTVRSHSRFRWWDYPIFATLTALHLTVLAFVLYHWITGTDWSRTNSIFLVLLGTVLIEFVIWEWRWLALPLMRVPRTMPAAAGRRVAAAVTFVPDAESIEMLEETVRAIIAIEYPHDTWVLDEGDDRAVHGLCERLGAYHFSRRHMPRYQAESGPFKTRTKYGNYNSWLSQHGYEHYDLVVAFDSDHIPRPDYLNQVLGYFDDESVAYVQPAQAYYNQNVSFIARAAAEETYAYYSSIQMTHFAVGYPILVGCHNTHRVTALRQIGGFAAHEADDMVMTLYYRAHGWRGVYVPQILARGITPVDWMGYLRQQRRWARSVLDFKLRVLPRYAAQLPLLERVLSYVHGIYYLRGPVTALRILLLLSMLETSIAPKGFGLWFLGYTAAIWLTVILCDFYRQRFFLDPTSELGLHWRSGLVAFLKWPYFVLAFGDSIRGNYGSYTITSKTRRPATPRGFAVTHGVVFLLVASAWTINFLRGPTEFLALHIATGFTSITSLVAVITALRQFPPPYQPGSRRFWNEWQFPVSSGSRMDLPPVLLRSSLPQGRVMENADTQI